MYMIGPLVEPRPRWTYVEAICFRNDKQ